MLIGYFDYIILGVLIILNIKFWNKKFEFKMGCFIGGFLFGFLLPLFSMLIELQIVKSNGGWMDNFEVAYTYLRFPTYWIIGIVQGIITGIKLSYLKNRPISNDGIESPK